jgi:four helix bundle protein
MAGVQSFEELHCWQRAHELKLGVYGLIRSGPVREDVDFRNQIRNAAAGGPRLIAEGCGRYLPKEFIKYLRWANGEVQETSNHLRDGFDQGYFPKAEVERLVRLAKRASKAIAGLIRYLENCPDPRKQSQKPPKRIGPKNGLPKNPNPMNPRNPRNPRNENPMNPLQPDEPNEPDD